MLRAAYFPGRITAQSSGKTPIPANNSIRHLCRQLADGRQYHWNSEGQLLRDANISSPRATRCLKLGVWCFDHDEDDSEKRTAKVREKYAMSAPSKTLEAMSPTIRADYHAHHACPVFVKDMY